MSAKSVLATVLAIDVVSTDRETVVKARGEVDGATAPLLREALVMAHAALLREGLRRALVLDLSEVTFLDASALGVLVGVAKRARRLHSDLVLREPSRMIVRLLEITGLLRAFRVDAPAGVTSAVPARVVA